MKERNIEELFTDAMNECAVSCEVGTEGFCPGTKRRGPDANHPPSSRAEVKTGGVVRRSYLPP